MPFYLKDRDFSSELANVRSALIVPCRFCPAASLAVRERTPYIDLFRRLLRTGSYESYIRSLRSRLESEGIKTKVFDSKFLHQFVVCMWTSARRQALARESRAYDAVIVLGCDAAVEAVRRCVGSSNCRVIAAMEVEGIMNVTPTVHLPFTIRLDVSSVTRVLEQSAGASSARDHSP